MDELYFMKRALRLARRAAGRTSPNPMVGAVVVKGGHIIAEDYHRRPGQPHAEALALKRAGGRAKGSTMYVTLEPCSHTEKRTPPCADAVIGSGVKRVVVAMEDPNPLVSGRGIRKLKKAGIAVEVGALKNEAMRLNEVYIKHITTGRPFVILKAAMSLDGKIATPEGQSKWITGEKARRLVHRTRSRVGAILTAIGTVKADNPELTARLRGGKDPVRVVIDPELEIDSNARVLQLPPDSILVTKQRNEKAINIEKTGVKIINYKVKLELDWLMALLSARGITSVLIEGGSSLNAHAFNEGIVDMVMFFIAPMIIGGKNSFPVVGGNFFRRLEEAYRIKDVEIKRVGEDMLVEGRVEYPERRILQKA